MPQKGPASTRERSSTRTPSSERAGVVMVRYYNSMTRLRERASPSASSSSTAPWARCSRPPTSTAEDFGGPALRGLQRAPEPHAARRHPRHPRGLPRRRRRRRLDQHLRLRALRARASTAWPTARTRSRARRPAWPARRPATRFVIGAMGPSTRTITVTRNVTFDEVRAGYACRRPALIAGGADALLLETLPGHAQREGGRARRARGAAGGRRRRCR